MIKNIKYINLIAKEINNKPNLYTQNLPCPFCDFNLLKQERKLAVSENGTILWTNNKYPSIPDSTQTLIIETPNCGEDFSNYTLEHSKELLEFIEQCSLSLNIPHDRISIYKNFGSFSNGSVPHSHIHIVFFKEAITKPQNSTYEGTLIREDEYSIVNISQEPATENLEINLISKDNTWNDSFLNNLKAITSYARTIQSTNGSYNIYFDILNKRLKLLSIRAYDSPLFIFNNLSLQKDEENKKALAQQILNHINKLNF